MKQSEIPTTHALVRLLPKLFRGGQAFIGVEESLSGLSPEQAIQKVDVLPHSVAEIVAHINWWHRWMLGTIEIGSAQPYPKTASETWQAVKAEDWQKIKSDFYELLSRIDPHAARPDLASPVNHEETIGELLADMAMHTAHHFGQIICVRQAIGAWPPKGE